MDMWVPFHKKVKVKNQSRQRREQDGVGGEIF